MNKMSYEDYAAAVITRYVQDLEHYLSRIKRQKGTLALHQGRITVRSLRNALDIFQDLFPKQQAKQWARQLKVFAKSTSRARELDSYILFLSGFRKALAARPLKLAVGRVIRQLAEERADVQSSVVRGVTRLAREKTLRSVSLGVRQLKERKKKQSRQRLAKRACRAVSKGIDRIFFYEKYVRKPKRGEELHQLRIEAKHLRYTLEDFERFFGPDVRPFIKSVRSVQKVLGELHDADDRTRTLQTFISRADKGTTDEQALLLIQKKCKASRAKAYVRFIRLWQELRQRKVWDRMRSLTRSRVR